MMHQKRGIGCFAGAGQFSDDAAPLSSSPGKAAEAGVEGETVLLQDMDKIQTDLFGFSVRRRSE